uniref:Phospholipid-transporting ATPase n=1 Tax=Phallusia mammillata TaxID=59560 RepID=A0A6F9D7Z9_9ASCI|nr:phospholipid-transporting ATPase ID [Phallusia mammillata]
METLLCINRREREEQRDLVANDQEYNAKFNYVNNEIKTSRYTWYNFIILNLWEQLHRVVNVYFIVLLILQYIPQISSLNPTTTLIPIVLVLAITAVKDAVDDINRHKSDHSVNTRKSRMLKNGELTKEQWKNINVGNVIKLRNNEHVTADLLLLSTSEEHHLAYVETAELDGETNLKVRQALPETGEMGEDVNQLCQFNGAVKCEPPNNQLHKFTGNLYWNNQTYSIDNQSILLRGCILRNTQWCYGLVIFAGADTKLMQNTGKTMLKRTSIERLMNRLVWFIFMFLLLMATVAAIGNSVWETWTGVNFQLFMPWESYSPNPQMSGFLMFWSYIIILNTVVPISLYVSIEFIRLGQSFFINWDRLMFYDKKNLPAVARTTTLNEELGQIEYVFSDKTGTLTQNIMEFNKCTIAGKRYGDARAKDGTMVYPHEYNIVDLSFNEYAEKNFHFYDHKLIEVITSGDEDCALFFRLIAICHTVMPDESEDGRLVYQAQSPDEGALVSAARNFGFVFKSRTYDTVTILEQGKAVEYKVLAILDFDNVRKRMSVIVQDPQGKIMLMCKGADTVIYERLKEDTDEQFKAQTTEHLDEFAGTGLRTLCLAVKALDQNTFNVWKHAHDQASTALEDREDKLNAVYEEIERDLTLIGATAIEDKLQDGVPETIANLTKANIKIWVLTGDKQETAINIGYSCNMLTESMKNVFIITGYEPEEVEKSIQEAIDEIGRPSAPDSQDDLRTPGKNVMQYIKTKVVNTSRVANGVATPHINNTNEQESYGLVIGGHSLAHALIKDLELKFLELASHCSAVICCRVTPLQKAQVVDLVKRNKKAVTLAIGDGANDVSMIKAAHIGVGISGEEGTQAVLSSDFALGQFRYLERLLLVHGRWSYMRMCKFFGYFFYKNFAFTLVQFWYGIYNGFTAQSTYDDWFVTLYNIVYTSTPIFILALLEQDLNDDYSIRYPKLYLPGQKNELFNIPIFLKSIIWGIITSIILFFIPYGAFAQGMAPTGLDMTDRQTVSTVISTCLILVVTLQVALVTSFWTPVNHFFIWGSIVIFFIFTFALHSSGLYNLITTQFPFVGVATNAYSYPATWFTVLLVIAICILPMVAFRFVHNALYPHYNQQIQKIQMKEKKLSKMKTSESISTLDLFRTKLHLKRRTSRPKSGYAFSHERGFGNLITSGRMSMRKKNGTSTENSPQKVVEETPAPGPSKNSRNEGVVTESYKELPI